MPYPQAPLHGALANVILSATCPGAYEARYFHGSTAVAPLKQVALRHKRVARDLISTAQQPWPH
jgi:hypothetical protein